MSILKEAIKWYRKSFKLNPDLYAGINLATLLTVDEETHRSDQVVEELHQVYLVSICPSVSKMCPTSTYFLSVSLPNINTYYLNRKIVYKFQKTN